ncbi:DNA-processing protein DprA [Exiguobacterium aestuarii]|uniref:DNA-processing protein DprA n=1 Tax=Exiguobacterium aestuarii TaxID=273527 RepID=A0ABW2PHC0_9BACL|nr:MULTISPECIES: DNA-processing protein DprA [Exiguobacterium]MCT4785137.1 DNA-protecting protein DprA [Exiguobacterium aestuarii]
MNNDVWLAISSISGIGTKTLLKIYLSSPNLTKENYFEEAKKINFEKIGVRKNSISFLLDSDYMNQKFKKATSQIEIYKEKGIEVISLSDKRYPIALRVIDDPPAVLYCKGNINLLAQNKQIAVIGTRNATAKGMNAAGKIAASFSDLGYVIVSGLATGIDTGAHLGALESNGYTIAVLAGGVDDSSIYPKENIDLAKRILSKEGLLLSEYAPGTRPNKSSFVQRDRIQSGLSLGICPVQTDIKGGTQHTIQYAFTQNRIVFCPVPSELDHEKIDVYRGVHQLINEKKVYVIKNKNDYKVIDEILLKKWRELLQKNDSSFLNEKVYTLPVIEVNSSQLDMFGNDSFSDLLVSVNSDDISQNVLRYIEICRKHNITLNESIDILKQLWRKDGNEKI